AETQEFNVTGEFGIQLGLLSGLLQDCAILVTTYNKTTYPTFHEAYEAANMFKHEVEMYTGLNLTYIYLPEDVFAENMSEWPFIFMGGVRETQWDSSYGALSDLAYTEEFISNISAYTIKNANFSVIGFITVGETQNLDGSVSPLISPIVAIYDILTPNATGDYELSLKTIFGLTDNITGSEYGPQIMFMPYNINVTGLIDTAFCDYVVSHSSEFEGPVVPLNGSTTFTDIGFIYNLDPLPALKVTQNVTAISTDWIQPNTNVTIQVTIENIGQGDAYNISYDIITDPGATILPLNSGNYVNISAGSRVNFTYYYIPTVENVIHTVHVEVRYSNLGIIPFVVTSNEIKLFPSSTEPTPLIIAYVSINTTELYLGEYANVSVLIQNLNFSASAVSAVNVTFDIYELNITLNQSELAPGEVINETYSRLMPPNAPFDYVGFYGELQYENETSGTYDLLFFMKTNRCPYFVNVSYLFATSSEVGVKVEKNILTPTVEFGVPFVTQVNITKYIEPPPDAFSGYAGVFAVEYLQEGFELLDVNGTSPDNILTIPPDNFTALLTGQYAPQDFVLISGQIEDGPEINVLLVNITSLATASIGAQDYYNYTLMRLSSKAHFLVPTMVFYFEYDPIEDQVNSMLVGISNVELLQLYQYLLEIVTEPTMIDAKIELGVQIYINTSEAVEVVINTYDAPPQGVSAPVGLPGLNKYVVIEANATSLGTCEIRVYYTDEELAAANLTEDELMLYTWDEASQTWVPLSDQGVNTVENYVWANVNHFSVFAVFAAPTPALDWVLVTVGAVAAVAVIVAVAFVWYKRRQLPSSTVVSESV
ncbi:MAG: hypothetical protein ACTSPL_08345, partial [Candidatus Odinarchaeia archaeon]